MSYCRRCTSMGDTITSPSQVDPSLPQPSAPDEDGSVLVGEVTGAKRVLCWDFPPDHPYRQPGGVCYGVEKPADNAGLFGPGSPLNEVLSPTWLLIGAVGVGAYYLYTRKGS